MSTEPRPQGEYPPKLVSTDSPAMDAVALSESPAPGVVSLDLIAPSRGFWVLTWQQFRKRRDAYVALVVLGLLFLIALTAPLLANRLPWYVHTPTATSFPLIREFISPLSHLD